MSVFNQPSEFILASYLRLSQSCFAVLSIQCIRIYIDTIPVKRYRCIINIGWMEGSIMPVENTKKAWFHLPGLFEYYELYARFLPLYRAHRAYFYDWCGIGSIYGAPRDAIWSGGRISDGTAAPDAVRTLMREYDISARLTFSNSILQPEHLQDPACNALCRLFSEGAASAPANGVIVSSDLLVDYLQAHYPKLYLVSSTTKVLTDFADLRHELDRPEFRFVVPDFRLNKALRPLAELPQEAKDRVEFLCNECCWFGCRDRKACYEAVSRIALGVPGPEHHCAAPHAAEGYRFSKAMENPGFISIDDIRNLYLPMGFSQFKIEGRGLGSALILEFLLYYLTRPEYQIHVREALYLDNMLDLF